MQSQRTKDDENELEEVSLLSEQIGWKIEGLKVIRSKTSLPACTSSDFFRTSDVLLAT